ncbi:uncharacterized protein LOC144558849 isoform X2 [Carex rostrata]
MRSVGVAIPSLFSLPREREFLPVQRKKAFTGDSLKKSFIKSSRRHTILRCSSGQAAVGQFDSNNHPSQEQSSTKDIGFLGKWMVHSAEMRAKVAKLGLAAVLAYGLFDGVTYTTFFVLAFLGYEKSTGKNPAANLQALLGQNGCTSQSLFF